MVVADIAAERPAGRHLEVLSQAVEHSTRELGVEAHEVRSHTNDVIGRAVTIAHGKVRLGR